jgi:hypothetical protein
MNNKRKMKKKKKKKEPEEWLKWWSTCLANLRP